MLLLSHYERFFAHINEFAKAIILKIKLGQIAVFVEVFKSPTPPPQKL